MLADDYYGVNWQWGNESGRGGGSIDGRGELSVDGLKKEKGK